MWRWWPRRRGRCPARHREPRFPSPRGRSARRPRGRTRTATRRRARGCLAALQERAAWSPRPRWSGGPGGRWPMPAALCRRRRSFLELTTGELEEHVLEGPRRDLQAAQLDAPTLRPVEERGDCRPRLVDVEPVCGEVEGSNLPVAPGCGADNAGQMGHLRGFHGPGRGELYVTPTVEPSDQVSGCVDCTYPSVV